MFWIAAGAIVVAIIALAVAVEQVNQRRVAEMEARAEKSDAQIVRQQRNGAMEERYDAIRRFNDQVQKYDDLLKELEQEGITVERAVAPKFKITFSEDYFDVEMDEG